MPVAMALSSSAAGRASARTGCPPRAIAACANLRPGAPRRGLTSARGFPGVRRRALPKARHSRGFGSRRAIPLASSAASPLADLAAGDGDVANATVSIVSTLAFLLLIVLTVGVGYLSLKGWQDDRASKEEVEAFKRGESVGDASAASSGKQGKGPTLSKVGKGFAKRK